MGKIITILILMFVIVSYFFLFNLLPHINFSKLNESILGGPDIKSTTEKASFGDSVKVNTFHDGWFWNTRTTHSKTRTNKIIYFFGIIPLPMIINNFKVYYIHAISLIMFKILLLKILFFERRYS